MKEWGVFQNTKNSVHQRAYHTSLSHVQLVNLCRDLFGLDAASRLLYLRCFIGMMHSYPGRWLYISLDCHSITSSLHAMLKLILCNITL